MKKTASVKSRKTVSNGLQTEYRFNYRKAKPNRFAKRKKERRAAIISDKK